MRAEVHGLELDGALQGQIYDEFESASDYVWKAPRLIEHETKLEVQKLDDYFPNEPQLRALRWKLESARLESTFPYMIAVGNLLSATSLYESYVFLIARLLDRKFDRLRSSPGQGMARIHSFFKSTGLNYSSMDTYAAVEAAVSLRNCIAHCSGILDWSRDNSKLRDMVRRRRYLSSEHSRPARDGSVIEWVTIRESALGDRIEISNDYAHLTCFYFRKHLIRLVEEASIIHDGCVSSLREKSPAE